MYDTVIDYIISFHQVQNDIKNTATRLQAATQAAKFNGTITINNIAKLKTLHNDTSKLDTI